MDLYNTRYAGGVKFMTCPRCDIRDMEKDFVTLKQAYSVVRDGETHVLNRVCKACAKRGRTGTDPYHPVKVQGVIMLTCPKCKGRADMSDFARVAPFNVTTPKFGSCRVCGGEDSEDCLGCNGRGFVVTGSDTHTLDMVCRSCVAEMAHGRLRPSGNGYAVNYTTGSRAGEPGLFGDRKPIPYCMFGMPDVVAREDEHKVEAYGLLVCKACRKKLKMPIQMARLS